MAVAAVTPRVRTIVICDEAIPSQIEYGVFDLEGVRVQIHADSLPKRLPLNLFLLLSSPRKGNYAGKILIVNERTAKPLRFAKFAAVFQDDNDLLPVYVDLGGCVFPEAGLYGFEIYFSMRGSGEALKGEHPFVVLTDEE